LTAVGIDGNDNIYPIAFAIVEGELKETWKWFLTLLDEDLGISQNPFAWTFISDKQKGLIPAFDEKTCSCRRWDLTGIPCNHAIAAIWIKKDEPEIYVHECYTVD